MILTVTFNPAIDQTLWIGDLRPGQVNRATNVQLDPAGKGVNVSRMVHRLGWPTLALGFLGGDVGHIVQNALDNEGVQSHFVRVEGQTRIDVTIVDGKGATSVFAPGPQVDHAAFAKLEEMLEFWLQAGRILVLAGSLPPGVSADAYARFIEMARRRDVRCLVDADGDALRLAVAAHPFLIKPNRAEAERLVARSLPDLPSVARAAQDLERGGIEVVVISLGGEGAVCAHAGQLWHVWPPAIERRSTVGSGDSLVAGIAVALARGDSLVEGLRLGAAAGAATAASPGTALGTGEEVARLLAAARVEPLAESQRANA